VFVKICGITNLDDARAAVDAGADALGFNFWRPGRRYMAPERVAEIAAALPVYVWRVGVFVDEEPREILRVAGEAGLTAVQFHGSEAPLVLEAIGGFTKLKAFRIGEQFRPDALASYRADAFLLDGAGAAPGGNGVAFDWERAIAAKPYGRIVLAGGLTPENVGEAVRRVRPWGVDVASGVESGPGRKDPGKMERFVRAARGAAAATEPRT